MSILNLLKEATKLINKNALSQEEKNRLKDILCYLSEWRKNNIFELTQYPQLEFVLYNASRKLRTFGYNKLNNLTNKSVNSNDELVLLKDYVVDELYNTKSGYTLDRAQKEVLDEFESSKEKLFLSAPTSFGKTFLLKEIIYRHYEKYNNIVIVLPTVALLIEVTEDIEQFNSIHKFGYKIYNSIYRDLEVSERNIFILTPERVLRLLAIVPDIKIDFFFFDEIYKIDEDIALKSEDDGSERIQIGVVETRHAQRNHRAVAFRLALYYLLKKSDACYLAGPFIDMKNLRLGFLQMLKKHSIGAKEITFIPTLRNEIYFNKNIFKFSSPFENIYEKTQISKPIEKLIYTANKLGFSKENQAIVYCLYPAYTEKFAREFSSQYLEPSQISDQIKMFIEHLRKNYSFSYGDYMDSFEKWDFVQALSNQVGIHNGKFPKYFQREIMHLFNNGEMSTLFCTSTIVEGINTNAKTVVIYNNPSGKSDESKKFLLLNINGRAGRYLHHFVGNVVYLRDESIKIDKHRGISLDFKPYNSNVILDNLDLENIDDEDLSQTNKERKANIGLNRQLLPDEVFEQNRLIERKKQETILARIIKRINNFIGIEKASVYDFIKGQYFDNILEIWAEVGEIKETQIFAIKCFSKNYAENSYRGVLEFAFKQYKGDGNDAHEFANETYRKVFRNVKDTIEYQLPRIISLFESLLIRAFEIRQIELSKSLDLSNIIRFFEVGATTLLGIDMIEKAIPIVTVKKIEKIPMNSKELEEQRQEFKRNFHYFELTFDAFEKRYLMAYIDKYC
ncbi:MAG: DEAD/DEAH box helicase [Clostridia bacterium]|nr:DEAD/DEAH box helicase [Clostridia bacterium]